MLSERERQLFDALERQFQEDRQPAAGERELGRRASYRWLLEVAMGLCIALLAVSGLLGWHAAILGLAGAIGVLGFIHYHF